MALFDRKPGGFLDKANAWMTPERAAAFSAIGSGLSQMSTGQPVNLAPHQAALLQRQQRAEQKRALESSGLLSKFTPEQRAILAQMEPSAAQKIIAGALFQPPAAPTKGITVGNRIIHPVTGEVIYEGQEDVPERMIVTGADGFKYYTDTGERVLPDVATPADTSAPTVKEITLEDGSEAAVQWEPDTTNPRGGSWVPIDAPQGGGLTPPSGKLTESQSKLTLFKSMQDETAPILNEIEKQYDPANIPDAAARAAPLAGNFFQTEEGQIYQASAAVWAEGALRIATGAAATQPEIERNIKTYFAQPGDTPATIQFKSQLRAMYTRAIQRALGNGAVEGSLMLPDDFAAIVGTGPGQDVLSDEDMKYLDAN